MTAPAQATIVPSGSRVHGQCRTLPARARKSDRPLTEWRKARAVELATQGHTYQQIADELGYANRGTVHRVVQQTLHAHQADSVDTLRALEVARLDALQQALWDRAMGGHVPAAQAAVRIIEARARVLGLVQTGKTKRARCTQPQTVVVQDNDCRKRGCPDHT